MMTLQDIFDQNPEITSICDQVGFTDIMVYKHDDDTCYLLGKLSYENERVNPAQVCRLLTTELQRHYQCKIEVCRENGINPLYKATVPKRTANLQDCEALKRVFNVSQLAEVHFVGTKREEDLPHFLAGRRKRKRECEDSLLQEAREEWEQIQLQKASDSDESSISPTSGSSKS